MRFFNEKKKEKGIRFSYEKYERERKGMMREIVREEFDRESMYEAFNDIFEKRLLGEYEQVDKKKKVIKNWGKGYKIKEFILGMEHYTILKITRRRGLKKDTIYVELIRPGAAGKWVFKNNRKNKKDIDKVFDYLNLKKSTFESNIKPNDIQEVEEVFKILDKDKYELESALESL